MMAPEIARTLAARGVPSFPCKADKKPATPHGFKDASVNETAMRNLWRLHPGPLVGVPTGRASGFDVLDVDPRHGGDDWLAENAPYLPETRLHQTRGGGQHFLFRHRPGIRNSEARIASGVDVRGDGGYAIWWPGFGGFVVCRAPLADWPDWLAELALPPSPPPQRPPPPQPPRPSDSETEHEAALNLIGRALYSVETAQAGERHPRLRAAARTIGGVIDAAGIATTDAERTLLAAVERAGAEDMERAAATVAWGLENGRKAPLTLRGKR